jgi:signal peptidase I
MRIRLRRVGRKTVWSAALLVAVVTLAPSYVRAYKLTGASDAPTLLLGDHVWVNLASYDVRFPYTDVVLFSWAKPRLGELVLVQWPGDRHSVFKRVVSTGGDRVTMEAHHLILNGQPLTYASHDNSAFAAVPPANHLGSIFEVETIGGLEHVISFTPGTRDSFPEVLVPEGQCYVLGDNRDPSLDSRDKGSVPYLCVRGKVVSAPDRRRRKRR